MGEERENQVPPEDAERSGIDTLPPDYSTGTDSQRSKKPRKIGRLLIELGVIVVGSVMLAMVLQAFVVKPFKIPSSSMENTLMPGDRVLVNRIAYKFGRSPERGDVIVFESAVDPDVDYIKRVIAIEGDTVEINGSAVLVNGEPQIEDYIHDDSSGVFSYQVVPEDSLFVLGDNRSDSKDSRYWKPPWISENKVIGKAMFIYWPTSRLARLD